MPNLPEDSIQLSEREIDILRLVATGASNKEIAQKLFISPNTVKVHLRNIFAKIGVISRTEATLYAIRSGLVTEGIQAAPPPGAVEILPPGPASPPAAARPSRRWWWIGGIGLLLALILAFGILVQTGLAPTLNGTQLPNGTNPVSERWNALPPLPQAVKGLAVTNYENQIYVIGGESPLGITGRLQRFDPLSGTWQNLREKPTPAADIQAALIGEKIYVPGGRLSSGESSTALEVYDPRRDEWAQRASLPVPVSAYALVSLEGRLFLFGGWDGQKTLDSVYEYQPLEDTWQFRGQMPQPAAFAGAVAKGASIYLIGGWDGTRALDTVYQYYPEREGSGETAWVESDPLPEGRYAFGVAELANQIFVVGGNPNQANPLGLVYNLETNRWDNFEAAPAPVGSHLGLAAYEDYLITLGGEAEQQIQASHQICQVVYRVLMPVIRQDE